MPEYQTYRGKYSLKELFFSADLAAKITLLPIDSLSPDAAILFSDILVIAKAFGFELDFADGVGPVLFPLLKKDEDILKLKQREIPKELSFVQETIRILKKQLKVPLIGFCGGPFTVASYLIEEKPHTQLHKTKKWLYESPDSFQILLEKLTQATIEYLHMQIQAGAEAIQIFESHAHVLSDALLNTYLIPHLKRIIHSVQEQKIPVILFMRGACLFAKDLARLSPNAISLDWQKSLSEMRVAIPQHIAIQGNFDPHLLYAPKKTIKETVQRTLQGFTQREGYIAGLGHGVLPDIKVDAVRAFIDAVKEC